MLLGRGTDALSGGVLRRRGVFGGERTETLVGWSFLSLVGSRGIPALSADALGERLFLGRLCSGARASVQRADQLVRGALDLGDGAADLTGWRPVTRHM